MQRGFYFSGVPNHVWLPFNLWCCLWTYFASLKMVRISPGVRHSRVAAKNGQSLLFACSSVLKPVCAFVPFGWQLEILSYRVSNHHFHSHYQLVFIGQKLCILNIRSCVCRGLESHRQDDAYRIELIWSWKICDKKLIYFWPLLPFLSELS